MRKQFLTVFVFLVLLALPCLGANDDEITIFDSSGKPVAYIGDELTIYLWSGKPVAYLTEDRNGGLHIYGFNGKHLGWFIKGIVRDHSGNAVGGIKDVFSTPTQIEPIKSIKQIKPIKSIKEIATIRPILGRSWSDIPLKLFLLAGED